MTMLTNHPDGLDGPLVADGLEPDLVYVLDFGLNFVECNPTWNQFAQENSLDEVTIPRQSVLDAFSGAARARWTGIYDKLLTGQIAGYTEQFTCPSPTMRRTYRLTISPRLDATQRVVQLVHRTRLLREQPARHQDRQSATLRDPFGPASTPVSSRIHLEGSLRPLDQVGGDLIWERHHENGRRFVVLADVMGHDELAERGARLIKQILDTLPLATTGESVRLLNDELVQRLPEIHDDTMFATGLFLDIDPAQSCLRVSNFAHFGILFSEKGIIDPPGGLPIGLFPASDPWPETELKFDGLGRRLMAYTDGIVEQFDLDGRMFGTAGLLREFQNALTFDLKSSLDHIMASLDQYRGAAIVKDDQSLLAIEIDQAPHSG